MLGHSLRGGGGDGAGGGGYATFVWHACAHARHANDTHTHKCLPSNHFLCSVKIKAHCAINSFACHIRKTYPNGPFFGVVPQWQEVAGQAENPQILAGQPLSGYFSAILEPSREMAAGHLAGHFSAIVGSGPVSHSVAGQPSRNSNAELLAKAILKATQKPDSDRDFSSVASVMLLSQLADTSQKSLLSLFRGHIHP